MKRNTSNWSNFCMLPRRAGLSASAGLSCLSISGSYSPKKLCKFVCKFLTHQHIGRGAEILVLIGGLTVK